MDIETVNCTCDLSSTGRHSVNLWICNDRNKIPPVGIFKKYNYLSVSFPTDQFSSVALQFLEHNLYSLYRQGEEYCLFIHGLFNETVSTSGYIVSKSSELERCKEFEVLSLHFLSVIKENHKKVLRSNCLVSIHCNFSI